MTTPGIGHGMSEMRQLIKKRVRTATACAVIFVVSFATVVFLSSTDLRSTHPSLLWSLYVVALLALGGALVVGTHAVGLVRARRRIEKDAQPRQSAS